MKAEKIIPPQAAAPSKGTGETLRQRAEEVFRGKAAGRKENVEALSPDEVRQMLHELRVHQIELEMQNEELRRAHEELEAARARYFDLYDLAPVGYFILNEQGLILEINLTTATLLGVARSALVKQPLTRFILPEDQDIFYRHRKLLFETGAPQVCELRLVKKDDAPFWVRIDATAAQDANGAPVCRATLIDITERKRAEDVLRISEERYRTLFETMDEGFCIVEMLYDPDGKAVDYRFVEINPAFDKHTGLPQALGKTIRQMVPNHDAHWFEIYGKVARTGEAIRFENPAIAMQRYYDVYAFRIGGDGSQRVGILFNDITQRKLAEEELRKYSAELIEKNEELRVMTQQLWQTAKLATMGELSASIAHELNNPLAIVSLRIESLINNSPEDSISQQELKIIEQEVERMSNLVANLLQFSRRGQQQLSTVDIREEIEKVLELIYYHLRKRNIVIWREFAKEAPHIQADRQQLRQLFLNLFTNASDAMPQGGTLTIRVAAQPESMQVIVEVADTGMGIPPEILSKMSEPFYSTKPEGKGTGLGLAICRRIMKEHNGTFDIVSEGIPGKGTTARISLPVKNGKNAAELK